MAIVLDGNNLLTSGVINSMTAQSTATGATNYTFTNIPAGVRRITFMANGISSSGTAAYILQLGYGSTPTYQATGYTGESYNAANVSYSTNAMGIAIVLGMGAGSVWSGGSTLSLLDPSTNTWSAWGVMGDATSAAGIGIAMHGWSVPLGGTLSAIRFQATNGTDTFDAGKINILYE